MAMSRKKEKQEPYVCEYTRELREIKPILNQPTKLVEQEIKEEKGVPLKLDIKDISQEEYEKILTMALLKAEIKRVNAILRTTKNPREFKQNKKHLERLERKLKLYGK